jgi:hypothetical protein
MTSYLMVRSIGLSLMTLLVIGFAAGAARADEVHISGFTNGCFGPGCTVSASATFLGLTYSNSTFSGTTAGGFRGLGGNPTPGANFNNLGSFSLSTAPNVYTGQSFTLRITFTSPQGINGSNQATFTALLTGTVVSDNVGGIFVDFNNTPNLFTFADPNCEPDPTGGFPGQQTTCGSGSFTFAVNDLALDPGQTVSVTGQILGAQQSGGPGGPNPVPEPISMMLLGTGLAGLAGVIRRKRKQDHLS